LGLLEEVVAKEVAMHHAGDIVVWVDLSGGVLVAVGLGAAAVVGQAVVEEDSVDSAVEVLVVVVPEVNGRVYDYV